MQSQANRRTFITGNGRHQSATRPHAAGIVGAMLSGVLLVAIAGCDQEAQSPAAASTDEFAWARTALQRNPNIEVLAADAHGGVFTVKIKRTGQTQVVKVSEVVAAPASELAAMALASSAPAATSQSSKAAPEKPAGAAAESSAPNEPEEFPEPPAEMEEEAASPPAAAALAKNYTIERAGGRVKVSGPGVSIVSSGTGAKSASRQEPLSDAVDPVICEGRRMLHLDNRNIYVKGNAIIARGGCELYLTNSNVIADGTAVIAQDAVVHISNSTVEGGMASFEASDAARMYLRGSTFLGLPRRAEKAVVQDQGGNVWR